MGLNREKGLLYDGSLGLQMDEAVLRPADTGSERPFMSVRALLKMLVPGREDLLARAHTANADADMCRLVFIAYFNLAKRAEGTTAAAEKC